MHTSFASRRPCGHREKIAVCKMLLAFMLGGVNQLVALPFAGGGRQRFAFDNRHFRLGFGVLVLTGIRGLFTRIQYLLRHRGSPYNVEGGP